LSRVDYSKPSRREKVQFAVYYNVPNPHVTIHRIGKHVLEIHGGEHARDQGGWRYFVEEREAMTFAESLHKTKKLPGPRRCKKCFKDHVRLVSGRVVQHTNNGEIPLRQYGVIVKA